MLTTYFVDTSALIKRYLREDGSVWISEILERSSQNVIIISELAVVEAYSVITRLRHQRTLSAVRAETAKQNLLLHVADEYLVVPIDSLIMEQARGKVEKHHLRALDAIQLACAVNARDTSPSDVIVLSADNRLLEAAVDEGFHVENPNQQT